MIIGSCWHNRYIRSTHSIWSTVRGGYEERKFGAYQRPDNYLQAYTEAIGLYDIDRAYMAFDTGELLADKVVKAARLGLFVTDVGITDATVFISKGLWDEPVVPEDFALQTDETTDLGHKSTGDIVIGQYNWIDLNQAGIDWINQRPLEIRQHESYDWQKNAYLRFYADIWVAESFTPQTTHTVTKVRLRMRRIGSPGTLYITIKAADVNHCPTGPVLASATIDANTFTTATWGDWYLIDLGAGATLNADTEYVIEAHIIGGSDSNSVEWISATANQYVNGYASWSNDGGTNWGESDTFDAYFIEYETATVGGTKFCLRMYGDHLNIVPAPDSQQMVRFYSAQKGEGGSPLLEVLVVSGKGSIKQQMVKKLLV